MTCISATLEQVARGLYELEWYLSADFRRPNWDNEPDLRRKKYLHRAAMLGIIIHDGRKDTKPETESRAGSQ